MKNLISFSSFILAFFFIGQAFAAESVYQRVMRTGALRCGYVVSPPFMEKDPNTGAFSGISYDYINAVGEEVGIKVEWAEETGWGSFQEGLNANRYDAMCVAVYQSGARARAALLSRPAYYNGLYAYAREGDKRFSNFEDVDHPGVRITVIEGDVTQALRNMLFPKAKEVSLPAMSDSPQMIMDVVAKKADICFGNPTNLKAYNAGAKEKLVPVGKKPARLFANSFAVKTGEYDLKFLLDSAIDTIITSGRAKTILMPHKDDGFVPPFPGYEDE